MPRKIHFQVAHSTSSDEQHPASELNHHGPLVNGWQSSRFSIYPQEIILQLENYVRLRRIQLLSHQHLIASKIEFFMGDCTSDESVTLENARYTRLGYIELSSNERTGFKARELKSIHIDAEGIFIKLVIHKNYANRSNMYNQVSIVAINLLGDDIDKSIENSENQSETAANNARSDQISIIDDLAFAMYQDREIAAIIKNLDRKKQECVHDEKFEQARKFKQAIQELIKVGERLARYEVEKRQAIENEDYETAQSKKDKMELYRTETYKQLQLLNLLDVVIEGGEGTEFLKRLQEIENNEQQQQDIYNQESPRPLRQQNYGRNRNPTQMHRSPESAASYGAPPTLRDSSSPPLPNTTNATHRASVMIGGAGYTSPDYPKPRTPYEDKVVPTLRNRNRPDGGNVQNSLNASNDTGIPNNDETESLYGGNAAQNDDATAELTQAEMIEANQMMVVFDKQLIGKLYHRNHARREEALDEIYQILSSFSGDQEDARAHLRAGSFVVARMFRVDVLATFSHSLKLFHLLMNDYVRKHAIQKQDILASLERVLPVLLQRTGDSNARLRQKAQETIIESASYPELKPLHIITHYCVLPFNKTCAPRLAISRCELIEELMKILDVKTGDNGLTVDNVSKFCAQALEHNAGEVRELAIKLLLSLYKTHGTIVKRYLPPDNEQTRRIKKYRDIFDAFDRMDGRPVKGDEKSSTIDPSESARKPGATSDTGKRDTVKQPNTAREQQKSFDAKALTSKSRTPTRLDRKTPTTSVADESEFTPENTCIFCGEKNEDFVRDGLEQHYWANCPMLRRCQECNQVVEIGISIDHLLRECEKKGKYQQCPRCTEAVGNDYDTHIKLKECHETKPNTNRCPLCHMNIPEGDKPWRDHLMGVDGCVKNARRIQALKKNKYPQHQQQKSVVVPTSQVTVMKKTTTGGQKKATTTVK
ncbi:unnamed protein product [Rotaria magnacalcarata]|uniref:Centrosomal protein of 104 kDa n=1 Tax=Rotaria magnacalcarata TaxID=392030 RepID=A0A818Y2U2_9BILA|nr:unnamed protein product [Rotaria magnacalcarata]CAF2063179.1 unnamed protein product [Rotaria magnacalcarata]CAF3747950.1 unnamed protein product [Rotaria magnacalcarata]CAF3759197.1 unnamed protein product [Rotaria magnacalcarata]